ncbi:cytochrome c-type biogenesis protein CcmH [Thiorhodococcus mannitoliphagus]|uniref:Cytochrome c-type biogenesis protein n=1 Tax=Thiorhodococcus mannitoliphagus TaxID=329406 RepID=A0A6P1E1E5_9GAMM|nr:cytochrome c-type biogenesis protein [Thiorhodococcus mannitoliphagus]NEX23141.1 cytochrome c-type biogenesis protein CcmH [Thiorhodococcus mannitoliphagus]
MIPRSPKLLPAALALASALTIGTTQAYTLEEFTFEDPSQTANFRDLIGELRCLVCQNESLAGSQASVAQDLRNEVYRMMQEGKTRDEVVDFLVARYGDFVLYDPPIKPSTYILWFGPFLFLALGGFLLMRAIQRKKAEPEQDLSDAERARLQQLLADTAVTNKKD